MPATATGDPYITTFFGFEYQLHGQDGSSYLLLNHDNLSVAGRIKAIEIEKTYFDQILIKTGEHTVQIDTDLVLVDGLPVLDSHRVPGDWVWIQDRTVAVGAAGWLLTIFRDPGADEIHQAGVLKNIEHLSVYVDEPFGFQGATGLFVDGFPGGEEKYVLLH